MRWIPWILLALAFLFGSLVWALARAARGVYERYRRGGGSVLRFEPAARRADPPGRGALILSQTELYFERYFPPEAHRIPLDSLLGAECPPRAAGWRATRESILAVTWRDAGGSSRTDLFEVRDAEAWVEMLRRLAGPCPSLRSDRLRVLPG